MSQQQMERYVGIIDEMLRTNRIYLIEKPKKANQSPLESPILQRIYDESEFWVRPVLNNIADMKDINFSVSE